MLLQCVSKFKNINLKKGVEISFTQDKLRFDYFYRSNQCDALVVLMPAALSNRELVPKYSRWSWTDAFIAHGFDALAVSDPTLFLSEQILGGWCQGSKNHWALASIVDHVIELCEQKCYSRVIFQGSSLGGFCSIQACMLMASRDIDCEFFVENPQTNLFAYHWQRHKNELAKVSYHCSGLEEVAQDYVFRVNLFDTYQYFSQPKLKGVIVSKESDEHHHEKHVIPFLRLLGSDDSNQDVKLVLISLVEDDTGHTALNKNDFFMLFRQHCLSIEPALPADGFLRDLRKRFKLIVGGNLQQQKKQGFYARKDANPVPIDFPMKWRSYDSDRNLAVSLEKWTFLKAYWCSYFETKDPSILMQILLFMFDWYRYSQSAVVSKKLSFYDMAVGQRALHLGLFKSLIKYAQITPEMNDKFNALAYMHLKHLSDEDNITQGNHAIYQALGFYSLASAFNEAKYVDLSKALLTNLIANAFDENFVSTENSPYYHEYNIGLINKIPKDIVLYDGVSIEKIISNASEILPWFTGSDKKYYLIGATEGQGKFSRLQNADLDFEAFNHRWMLKDLNDSGYQILKGVSSEERKNNIEIVFYGPNNSYTHAHADHLSFLFYLNDSPILIDSGKYTYNHGEWRDYFTSDKAHNTLGYQEQPCRAKDTLLGEKGSYLEKTQYFADCFTFKGCVEKLGLRHTRKLSWDVNNFELIIEDFLVDKDKSSSAYELRFHFAEDVELKKDDNTYSIKVLRGGRVIAILEVDPSKVQDINIVIGQTEPEIQGWVSYSYHSKQIAPVLLLRIEDIDGPVFSKFKFKRF
ncbi:Heparinase II/III-like protein [Vreelandella titanicae]|uniref:heparinase II/III family protein n=1 Tax=Vreelandella titanicae TaxID=664683 RepID=UPI0008831CD9|nr:heparinase II/III-family protein [Halomonas titanicae]SDI96761.1 Heparinase II/III-like protein [Halomonas titanicae]